jgi:hypothetical protein
MYEQETFWNKNMANNFGNEFDKLTKESKEAMNKTIPILKGYLWATHILDGVFYRYPFVLFN